MTMGMIAALAFLAGTAPMQGPPQIPVDGGVVEGVAATSTPAVTRFLGIPFAAPPVGPLRWREPQPVLHWTGVRKAVAFGANCMQQKLFSDMIFRSPQGSEDCLYLNVWTPADLSRPRAAKLPVLVYIYGGGLQAGDASERRYDGAALAARGMIVVTMNYRLNVFGFLAHPALTAESPYHASGNYGLLDQAAALAWVTHNVAAFGGDPAHVTIGGESAGSMSVSALMASPLTRRAIAGAIGESGALMGPLTPVPLTTAERGGTTFGESLGATTLAALRAMPADRLLAAQGPAMTMRFGASIDGHMLIEAPAVTFAAGRQARVPLLVGTNSQEAPYQAIFGKDAPTLANYRPALIRLFGDGADRVATLYPVTGDADAPAVATALASDRFLGWATWKWFDLHRRSGARSFLYEYRRVRPAALDVAPDRTPPLGAIHSAEIEYALGNLDVNPIYAWTDADRRTTATMSGYWANFVKNGDPNGDGLPVWPHAPRGDTAFQRQAIDAETASVPFPEQERYIAMEPLVAAQTR